jgi:Flp pilus assembly protein TadD
MTGKALLATAVALTLAGCAAADLTALTAGDPRSSDVGDAAPKFASSSTTTASLAARPKGDLAASAKASSGPNDPKKALADAHTLRTAGKSSEARVLLDKAYRHHEANRDLQVALGLVELDLGNPKAAEELLVKANQPGAPDWQVLSGLGVAASSLGRQADAQKHLKNALLLSPNNPAVLNNLAISYILERKPAQAEAVLKQATAQGVPAAELADTLALARTLKGRLAEAAAD